MSDTSRKKRKRKAKTTHKAERRGNVRANERAPKVCFGRIYCSPVITTSAVGEIRYCDGTMSSRWTTYGALFEAPSGPWWS